MTHYNSLKEPRTWNTYYDWSSNTVTPINKDKCQLLVANDVGSRVNFPDGTPVPRKERMEYLGVTFTTTVDVSNIIRQKITEATATMRTLQPF